GRVTFRRSDSRNSRRTRFESGGGADPMSLRSPVTVSLRELRGPGATRVTSTRVGDVIAVVLVAVADHAAPTPAPAEWHAAAGWIGAERFFRLRDLRARRKLRFLIRLVRPARRAASRCEYDE